MKGINRRRFLQLAGAGSLAAATAGATTVVPGLPTAARLTAASKTVFAGHPAAMTTVALPGLSRIIRITDVQALGGTFRILGEVDDRSQLQRGESRSFDLFIDPAQGLARTSSLGSPVVLQLEG